MDFNFVLNKFKVVVEKETKTNKSINLIKELLQEGILLNPKALPYITSEEIQMIKSRYGFNLKAANSTFYKSIKEVVEKSDFEYYLDQILNYFVTYNYNIHSENKLEPYIPNDELDLDVEFLKSSYVFIDFATKDELKEKVENLLYSKIALNEIDSIVSIAEELELEVDFEKLDNRELKIHYATSKGFPLKNIDDFFVQLIYTINNNTKIIKNKSFYNELVAKSPFITKETLMKVETLILNYIEKYNYDELTANIRRHKKALLIIRKLFKEKYEDSKMISLINLILRNNKTNNIKKQHPLSSQISNSKYEFSDFAGYIEKAPVFQLAKYYNLLSEKINKANNYEYYKIRNGSVYVKDKTNKKLDQKESSILQDRLNIIKNELAKRSQNLFNGKKVILPDTINLAFPTSGKSFVNEIPEFSKVKFPTRSNIGIYWEGKRHEHIDLDLHAVNNLGEHIGWNSSRDSDGIYYSGDMTALNKYGFAAEYMSFTQAPTKENVLYLLNVSRYYSPGDYKFKFLIGEAELTKNTKFTNEKVIFYTEVKTNIAKFSENLGAVISDGDNWEFVFLTSSVDGRVPNKTLQGNISSALLDKIKNKLTLEEFISMSNAEIYKPTTLPESTEDEFIDLSLDSLTQEKLLNALSE